MPKLDSVDLFYVSMPVVEDISDGSQDALLFRVAAGGKVGWGEAEASPLPSIASWIAPMSHGFCHPIASSVLGETIDSPADIARIAARVKRRSLDILQTDHTLSGLDEALRYAAALEAFTSAEPLPLIDLQVDRTRALVTAARGRPDRVALAALCDRARAAGLGAALPDLEAALANANATAP